MTISASIPLLIIAGFLGELIDSALGMLYGAILSPLLIIAGYAPLVVVPSILLTQAVASFVAAIGHHRLRNADFTVDNGAFKGRKRSGFINSLKRSMTRDLKIASIVSVLGVLASGLAAFIAPNLPKAVLRAYIGSLVLVMGVIIVSRSKFKFSWSRMFWIGAFSAFNKGLSGSGFGPIMTAGQILSGRSTKNAIGATKLSEVPICVAGFLIYWARSGMPTWNLITFLGAGALVGAFIGPYITAQFKSEDKVRMGLGAVVIVLGVWTLLKTWLV